MLRSASERRRIQTAAQGPELAAELAKRGGPAQTARMLAWKQPSI